MTTSRAQGVGIVSFQRCSDEYPSNAADRAQIGSCGLWVLDPETARGHVWPEKAPLHNKIVSWRTVVAKAWNSLVFGLGNCPWPRLARKGSVT